MSKNSCDERISIFLFAFQSTHFFLAFPFFHVVRASEYEN